MFNLFVLAPAIIGQALGFNLAGVPPAGWPARSPGQVIACLLLLAGIGLALAIAGPKVFNRCPPGELRREVLENKNLAAAVMGGALILGAGLVLAAALLV